MAEEGGEAAGKGAKSDDGRADDEFAHTGEPVAVAAVGDGLGVEAPGDECAEEREEP